MGADAPRSRAQVLARLIPVRLAVNIANHRTVALQEEQEVILVADQVEDQCMIRSMTRAYAHQTPTLQEALDAAPEADLVKANAPQSERVTAWVEYGYHRWQEDQARQAKIDAYRQIAAEDGRGEYLQASVTAAVAAGVL